MFGVTYFHTWKFMMQMVLEERDLRDVPSRKVKLEHYANALDQAVYKKSSCKARNILCLAMEDSKLPPFRSSSDRMIHYYDWKLTSMREALRTF